MATIKTKADLYDLANERARIWKSLSIADGDVLVTGLKDVWAVHLSDPTKWGTGGWTVGSGSTAGQVTIHLSQPFTGRVYVIGR